MTGGERAELVEMEGKSRGRTGPGLQLKSLVRVAQQLSPPGAKVTGSHCSPVASPGHRGIAHFILAKPAGWFH